jgi:hypothetical protein
MRGMVGWNVTSPPFRSLTFTPERSISSSEMSVFFSDEFLQLFEVHDRSFS